MKARVILIDLFGVLFVNSHRYSKDLEILIQQGSSTGAYPIISEERRSPQLDDPKSSKTKSRASSEQSFPEPKTPVINKQIVSFIAAIKGHYKIVIASASDRKVATNLIKRSGLNFDHVLLTPELQFSKSSEQFYQYVAELFEVNVEEIFLIDDTKENVNAAHKAGARAILYLESTSQKELLDHA